MSSTSNNVLVTWNKNISLLKERFPQFYDFLSPAIDSCSDMLQKAFNDCACKASEKPGNFDTDLYLLNTVFNFWDFSRAKNGALTAKDKDSWLHSPYDPQKEALRNYENPQTDKNCSALLFMGIGLGYEINTFALHDPEKVFVILENDPGCLFAALSACDFSPVFNCKTIIISNATDHDAWTVLESLKLISTKKSFRIITKPAFTKHNEQWFTALCSLIDRNIQKNQINENTKERFSKLWVKNAFRNINSYTSCDGINIYKNKLNPNIPALVIAAGPSLKDILPFLKEISQKAVLICTDTALKAVLKAGVEPDFIVLLDPQYYAACHINGQKALQSVLIAESAVYPTVFRFECKKTVLASSLFPFGKYLEQYTGTKGELKTGGSVSTSAWDFARFIGAKTIFMAGLDLGYPEKTTHIKGSTFEEKSHSNSIRTIPCQNKLSDILFSDINQKDKNYLGQNLITDSRMKLFAWWFEAQCQTFKEIRTFTLSRKGLFIPGLEYKDIKELLSLPVISGLKEDFFRQSEASSDKCSSQVLETTMNTLHASLSNLLKLCQEGQKTCKKALSHINLSSTTADSRILGNLEAIDRKIMDSREKDVCSLVFPSQTKLDSLFDKIPATENPYVQNIKRSQIIYQELEQSLLAYLKFFPNSN